MSPATTRVPLIDLSADKQQTRGLGILEVKTSGKNSPLPLAGVDIKARVADRVASVTITQTFKNTHSEHLEAVYIFPLSGGCVVSDFEMRVGTRVVKGVVQERAEARRQYQQAIDDGKRAALLEQERDDVFTVQVGNLPPGEEVTVVMTYSERLPFFENGKTELRLPLVVGQRYIPGGDLTRPAVGLGTAYDTDQVPDASRITPPMLAPGFDPQVGLAISVEIASTDESGASGVSELGCSQHATSVSLDADTVRIELAKENERLNRDFVLQWRLAAAAVRSSMLVYKDGKGEMYGMLSITPPKRDGYVGAPRDVVFVLDRSGSMGGIKMTSAARSCALLLRTMGPNDRFAILAFDNVCEWLTLPVVQGRAAHWISADEEGLEKGEKFLRSIEARGGTEMDMAINEAFQTVAARPNAVGRVPVVVILTDGEVGNESAILRRVQQQLGESRLFAIGIDTAVNSGLLKRLANLGGGTSTFVSPGASLENALRGVGREIGAPMITDLQILGNGGTAAVESGSLAPSTIPDLFDGRAVTAFVKLSGKGNLEIAGHWSDGKRYSEKVKMRHVKVPAIAQLWAKSAIADLEDQYRMSPGPATKQKIIELAVAHSLLTKFTAFVAVDEAEIVNKDGSLKTVVQAVEAPAEWDMFGQQPAAGLFSLGAPPLPAQAAPGSSGYGSAPRPKLKKGANERIDRCREFEDALFVEADEVDTGNWQAFSLEAQAAPSSAPESQSIQLSQQSGAAAQNLPARDASSLMGQLTRQRQSSAPTPPPAQQPTSPGTGGGGGWFGQLKNLFGGDGRDASDQLSKREMHSDLRAIKPKLVEFAEALRKAFDEIKAGTVPDCTALENARQSLLESLAKSLFGTEVPALQKFLRSAAVELVQSTKQPNITAAGLQSLWERHMPAFQEAESEATTQLTTTGSSSDERFWEASV